MTLDKSGKLWRGEDFADLADYLRHFRAEGYPVDQVVESVCAQCTGRAFRVLVDDIQGCAQRICVGCGTAAFIADSAEYWDEADPGDCECPCGGGEFAVAVGFSLHDDGEVLTTPWASMPTGRSTTAPRVTYSARHSRSRPTSATSPQHSAPQGFVVL